MLFCNFFLFDAFKIECTFVYKIRQTTRKYQVIVAIFVAVLKNFPTTALALGSAYKLLIGRLAVKTVF